MKKIYSIRLCDETAAAVAETAKKAQLTLGIVATQSRVIEAAIIKAAKTLTMEEIALACKRSNSKKEIKPIAKSKKAKKSKKTK